MRYAIKTLAVPRRPRLVGENVAGLEWRRGRVEEMPPQFRKLLTCFRNGAALHLRDSGGVVQRVAAGWSHLIDSPNRPVVMAVIGYDFCGWDS